MKEEENTSADTPGDQIDIGHAIVLVTVDRVQVKVRGGEHQVSDFKKLVGVSEELALDQLINGKFEPLADDDKLHVKGGEIFVSHVRTGSSS